MKNVSFVICCVLGSMLFFSSFTVCASNSLKVRIGEEVPNFVLEDVDENRYELEQMKGKVVILIMGSKSTEEDINRWAEVLQQTFSNNDSLEIFTVAEMRNIPFFVSKSFIRKKVKEKLKKDNFPLTTLLDWDQKVNNLLGADKDKVDIFAINKKGILTHHQIVPYSKENFSILKSKIEEALKSGNKNKTKKEGGS